MASPLEIGSSVAVRATVVLVLAALGVFAMRRASSASRHAVLGFALAALLALPPLTMLLPRVELPILPLRTTSAPPVPTLVEPPRTEQAHKHIPYSESPVLPASAAPPAVRGPAWSLAGGLALVWLAGAAAALAQLVVSAWLVRRIARRAVPVREERWERWLQDAAAHVGLRRPVALVTSASVAVPVVWGYRRGVVMLPTDADGWPEDRARAFLLHELAHVRRYDCLVLALGNIVRALYWPHPLAWWAVGRLRREAERACDDRVLASGASAPDYAHHLLEAARGFQRSSRPLAVLAVAERGSFEDRLLALLDPGLRRGALTARAFLFGGVVSVVAVGSVAAVQPVTRAVVEQLIPPSSAPPAPSPAATARPAVTARPVAAPARIEGVVKGPDGKPLANALLIVWPESQLTAPFEPQTVRTGLNGTFQVEPGRAAATYRVRVQAPALVARTAEGVRVGQALAVSLRPGATLAGRVLDEVSRKPIAGALVKARPQDDQWAPPVSEPDAGYVVAKTKDDGSYLLEGLETAVYILSASTAVHSSATIEAVPGRRASDLLLAPGGSIAGVVTDHEARPIAGASVMTVSFLPGLGAGSGTPVTTDGQGRFKMPGLSPGTYRVTAAGVALAPATVEDVVVETGRETRVAIRAARPYRLRGRLVADGVPVNGTVRVQDLDGVVPPRSIAGRLAGIAGDDGRFTIDHVPAASLSLAVEPSGYPSQRHDVVVSGKEPTFDIGDIVLEEGLVISGRVSGRAGEKIPEATVFARRHDKFIKTTTRADGTFRFGGLEPGSHRISVKADGYAGLPRDVDAGTRSVDLTLEKAGVLLARIVDENGRPVPTATGHAEPEPRVSGLSGSDKDRADANGHLRLERLVGASYVVRVYAPGFLLHTTAKVHVEAGQTRDLGTLTLSRGGTLRGVVVDPRGETVPGAQVAVSGNDLQSFTPTSGTYGFRTMKTDGGGTFEMGGLPAGVFKVAAGHRRYADSPSVEATVSPDGEPAPLRLVLRDGGRIIGTVRRRDGRAATDAFVTIRGSVGDVSPRSEVGPDGQFLLEPVVPGPCEVTLALGREGSWRSVFTKEVEVREGETKTLDLVVSDVRVSGRVTRGGRPLANVQVALDQRAGGFTMSGGPRPMAPGPQLLKGIADASGIYELIAPVSGQYTIEIKPLGKAPEPLPPDLRQVDIPDVEAHRLDVSLPDWSFNGMVAAADTGKPLEGATVRVIDANDVSPSRTTTDADGRFRFALVPASYKVHVEAPKYVAEDTTIDIVPDRGVERSFRLTRGGSLKTRVLGVTGTGVADVRVVAATEDGSLVRSARTAADGAAEITGLTAGRYVLLAAAERDGFAVQPGVTVDGVERTLALTPPVRQRLLFRDDTGKAMARTGVTFELLKVDGRWVAHEGLVGYSQRGTTDGEGAIESSLPAGVVDLLGYTSDRKQRGRVQVTAGDTAILVLKPVR